MSTKNKKAAATGIRYTDAQKKEIVDFVAQYNTANGRGGQSAASKKYKVTPLTISAWLKASGAPKVKKAAKPAKAPKSPNAPKSKKGVRYTPEQKQEVIDFVTDYNAANGRGGQSHAAAKFKLSVLTVATWLKNAGAKSVKGAKAVKASTAPSALTSKIASLIEVGDQLRKAESETEKLRAKYDALRASIQALI